MTALHSIVFEWYFCSSWMYFWTLCLTTLLCAHIPSSKWLLCSCSGSKANFSRKYKQNNERIYTHTCSLSSLCRACAVTTMTTKCHNGCLRMYLSIVAVIVTASATDCIRCGHYGIPNNVQRTKLSKQCVHCSVFHITCNISIILLLCADFIRLFSSFSYINRPHQ